MRQSTLLITFAVLAFLSATLSSPVLTHGTQSRLQLERHRPRKAAFVDSDRGRYDRHGDDEERADDKDADDEGTESNKLDEDDTHGFGQPVHNSEAKTRHGRLPTQSGPYNGEHPDFYFDGGYFSGSGYWQSHDHDSRSPPNTVPQPGPEPFDPDTVSQPGPFDPDTVPQPGPFDPYEPEPGPYDPTPPTNPFPSEDDCIGRRRPCVGRGTRPRANCRDGYPGPCVGRGAYPERRLPQDSYYDRQLSTFVLQLSYDYDSEERVKKHAGRRRRNFKRGTRHIHH